MDTDTPGGGKTFDSAHRRSSRPIEGIRLSPLQTFSHVGKQANSASVPLPNEELKLTALASDAAGSLRSPAALLMVRRSLTPAR